MWRLMEARQLRITNPRTVEETLPSYNLPSVKEINKLIIEASERGEYNIYVPLDDNETFADFGKHRDFLVEQHYMNHSPEYKKLHNTLYRKGYSHFIMEDEVFGRGLVLNISWDNPRGIDLILKELFML